MSREATQKKSSRQIPSLFGILVMALILGFGIELVINAVQWHRSGFIAFQQTHQARLRSERQAIERRSPQMGVWFAWLTTHVHQQWQQGHDRADRDITTVEHLPVLHHLDDIEGQVIHHASLNKWSWSNLRQLVWLVWLTAVSVALKTISVGCALFLFIFAAIIGLVDGLLARQIRTAEGGRESTFLFHRITSSLLQVPLWILVLYFALPITFQPLIAIVLLAVIFFSVCYLTTSQLKKYL